MIELDNNVLATRIMQATEAGKLAWKRDGQWFHATGGRAKYSLGEDPSGSQRGIEVAIELPDGGYANRVTVQDSRLTDLWEKLSGQAREKNTAPYLAALDDLLKDAVMCDYPECLQEAEPDRLQNLCLHHWGQAK